MLEDQGQGAASTWCASAGERAGRVGRAGLDEIEGLQVFGVPNLLGADLQPVGSVVAALTCPCAAAARRERFRPPDAVLGLLRRGRHEDLAAAATATTPDRGNSMYVDAHLRLVYQDRFSSAWLSGARSTGDEHRPWRSRSAGHRGGATRIEVDIAEDRCSRSTISSPPPPRWSAPSPRPSPGTRSLPIACQRLAEVRGLASICAHSPHLLMELSRSDRFVENV